MRLPLSFLGQYCNSYCRSPVKTPRTDTNLKTMTRTRQVLPNLYAFTTILLLSLNLNPAFSQQRWSIGPRVGANISNQLGVPPTTDVKWLPGWSIGGFIMYSDIRHFGISMDVLYSQKGAGFEVVTVSGTNISYKNRINYLEIPVLARYFLTLSGPFRPNFFIGPSVAFKLNAKVKEYEIDTRPQPEVDVSDRFRPLDLGLVGGIAFNFEVAKGKRVLLDARYTYGLSDVTVDIGSVRNSAITLNLSYGFGVGKK
jgi:hypothetical protein